ncbi:MAG: MerR family transcriptional regulator [Acetatifactor sp.]|nr:MerR family transcriptional regulator [Acetatifactor sp.]
MYKIGELSKLCNIPVKTLRYYDSEGILCPQEVDTFTGYRYYSAAQLSDCYRILALKELGFTLEEIRTGQNLPRLQLSRLLADKELELSSLVDTTRHRIATLRRLSAAIREEKTMYNIIIRKSEEIRIAYVRLLMADRDGYEQALTTLRNTLPQEIRGGRTILIDYETEYRSDSFDVGLGIEIAEKLPLGTGMVTIDGHTLPISEKTICFPAETACLICGRDEYDQAILALHQHLEEHHCQITGPTYQIVYEDGVTEIKVPICQLSATPQQPRNDDIQIPFENDENVIGHWELVDVLPSREQFLPGYPKLQPGSQSIKELYFLPEGEWYWCFGWTKGYLLASYGFPRQQSRNAYTIEKINGETYMFIEMRFETCLLYGGQPECWVLRQTDRKHYTRQDIRRVDPIPQAPADDGRVIGTWQVCDLVRRPEDFIPGSPNLAFPYDALFWRTAQFLPEGEMRNTFRSINDMKPYTDDPEVWRWVTGNVICNPRSTASMYRFQEYHGVEYLLIQWKSGDYTYGGEEPYWYVFQREMASQ